ncbi:hypothetical protein AYI68_g3936 [Smittium mucronatum]|uniref:Uncharacterized protein n=1 Tax=Smittium mucronatum TaxID=133383 RepID=A0A1R0GYG3_9FUNG|nr:hypothetical protein AYI68_g3936 [Smittium mucronatum]
MKYINPLYKNSLELGLFAHEYPFVLTSKKIKENDDVAEVSSLDPRSDKEKSSLEFCKRYWIHDCCARYSPRVLVDESTGCDPTWYNVASEVVRGRNLVTFLALY